MLRIKDTVSILKKSKMEEMYLKLSRFVLGNITVEYYQIKDAIEWIVIPTNRKETVCLPQKIKADSLIQAKLVGDDYPKGFSTGYTMRNSQTVQNLRFVEQQKIESSKQIEIQTVLADFQGNQYCHHVVWERDSSVLEVYTSFVNHSNQTQKLEMLSSLSLSNLSPFHQKNAIGNLVLTRYKSKWSYEGKRVTNKIEELQLEPSWKPSGVALEKYGQVGSMPVKGWFPYFALTDVEQEVTWAFTIAHPGSWQIEVYRLDEDLCVSGGLADRDYGHWLKIVEQGETFETPHTFLTVLEGDERLASQQLTTQLENKPLFTQHPTEENLAIQFNEFCTTWGLPTEQLIQQSVQVLKNRGIQYYIIDAGWYAGDKGWEKSHGDWQFNQTQFPNGLEPVLANIRAAGMIPGIWFELETVGTDSVASTFFDQLLSRDDVTLTAGTRRFWNMRHPKVREYLKVRVIDFLKQYQFGYLKIDYNESFGIGFDGEESFGEANRLQLAASQAFIREIQEALPDLVIENCSSGGHRLEYSMMGLTDLSSFSDAHETASIPVIAANLHHLMLPRQSLIWAVIRKYDTTKRLYYSMTNTFLGRMCLSGDVNELTATQWAVIDQGIAFYQAIKELIKHGTTTIYGGDYLSYRALEEAQIVLRKNHKQAYIIVHNFKQKKVVLPIAIATIYAMYGLTEQNISLEQKDKEAVLTFPEEEMACALLIDLQ